MSAWGISNFENDSALDWIDDIIQKKEVSDFKTQIETFLKNFSSENTSLIECAEFLALAETIAGLVGNPSEDFPEELKDWIENKYIKIEQTTIDACKKGVTLVMTDSEAKEMYLDSGYFKSWEKAQKSLVKRLN